MPSNTHEVTLDGVRYTWDGNSWFETKSFLRPPTGIVSKLNALVRDSLASDDATITDANLLMDRARQARESQQFERAVALLRRVLVIRPDSESALAILCSVLRAQGVPDRALAETDLFGHSNYPPLITSRAAAMCDLGRWEQAKKLIGRVLAMPGDHGEAFSVVHRIKVARPDLYPPKDQ
jgi:tetratricopeptide (TPR) repeat protein